MALKKMFKTTLTGMLIASLCFNTPSYAQGNQEQTWNFENVEIQAIINKISEQTGKNFVVDPRVQAKVTLISHQPISPDEAYQVFLSILQVYGFSAVESGEVIKIVPRNEALQSNTPIMQRQMSGDILVTKVIPLNYISAQELYPTLKPLIPNTSYITANNSSNHIIITDIASNIDKIEKIVQKLDQPASNALEIIPIHHASAVDLAETLSNLLQQKKGMQALSISVGADDRTNTLLLSGGTRDLLQYIRGVVVQLDVRSDAITNSEVIYLKYMRANDAAVIVANFLEEALKSSKEQSLRQEVDETGQGMQAASGAASGQQSTEPSFISRHLAALKNYNATDGVQGTLYAENEKVPKSGAINRFVQWEDSTNAIIVKAPPALMRSVKNIISKLDIRRPQILIEVIIAEVNLDRLQDFGIDWTGNGNGDVRLASRFFGPLDGGLGTANGFQNATGLPLVGGGLTVGFFKGGTIRALLRALQTDTTANILSTPNVVTLDNQTALIKVGEKVPFAVGQTNNDNVGGNPFTSFDREEVGLSLTIRPQITHGKEIKMEIESILSNVIPNSANPNTGGNPRTSERTLVTNVMVDDGRMLVLGGLTQDTWQKIRGSIPFLGNIPLLRLLAGRENKELVKKNLMIFLKPTILFDDCKTTFVSGSKYDRMRLHEMTFNDMIDRPFVDEPPVLNPEFSKGPTIGPEVTIPPPYQEPREIFLAKGKKPKKKCGKKRWWS